MCDIKNETDLKEAVIYKVVRRLDNNERVGPTYTSPYTDTEFKVGPVGLASFNRDRVKWDHRMVGRISGFVELEPAQRLCSILTAREHDDFTIYLVVVRVRVKANHMPILDGTGRSIDYQFASDTILVAPHVLDIEEIVYPVTQIPTLPF